MIITSLKSARTHTHIYIHTHARTYDARPHRDHFIVSDLGRGGGFPSDRLDLAFLTTSLYSSVERIDSQMQVVFKTIRCAPKVSTSSIVTRHCGAADTPILFPPGCESVFAFDTDPNKDHIVSTLVSFILR